MFKFLALFLLSFIAIPAAKDVGSSSFTNETKANVVRTVDEGVNGVLHGYTYEDKEEGETKTHRVFDSRELGPQVNSVFCAPSGHMFYLTISDEMLDEIFAQMDFVHANYSYVNIVHNYCVRGIELYLDSNSKFGEEGSNEANREFVKNLIRDDINNREVLKVEEVSVASDLYVHLTLQFNDLDDHGTDEYGWTINHTWYFEIYSKVVEIKPYGENDYVLPRLRYFQRDEHEKRLNVDAVLIPGFFNEFSNDDSNIAYNPYGWLTETTTIYPYASTTRPDGSPHYYCDYTLSLVAFGNITIGYLNNLGAEMVYPTSPIEAKLKLEFVDDSHIKHVYFSEPFILGDPNMRISVDGPQQRTSIQQYSEHTFSLDFDIIDRSHIGAIDVIAEANIERLYEDGVNVIYCYNNEPLPESGREGVYYYYPSEREKQLHSEGRDEEFINDPSEGEYYTWQVDQNLEDGDDSGFGVSYGYSLFSFRVPDLEEIIIDDYIDEFLSEEEVNNALNQRLSIPVAGRFSGFNLFATIVLNNGGYAHIERNTQSPLEVTFANKTETVILIDNSDTINLIAGAGDIDITPTISSKDENADYYYDFELNKDGVLDVVQDDNGKLTIHPSHSGLVELTIGVESSEFTRITKKVQIRVLDSIYDVTTIEVSKGFHYAYKDLTAAISVRGFTDIQNVNIDWKVVNKAGEEIPEESIVVHKNASMTLLNPDSDDYTITASYEGIELNTITVQVRYVDLNSFLRINIWWIFLITIGFVVLVFFFANITKHSKTTVENIERVYQVFCKCYSDDKLTKEELNKIKREITRCVHRCEDLNIDALNQYEKATRYLRKSLADTKNLLKEFDNLNHEERSVLTDRLDKDLAKALNVAKEIEAAKEIIDSYHTKANRKNYEVPEDDSKK